MFDFKTNLQQRKAAGLYRQRRIVSGAQEPNQKVDGRELLSFCSNDYLGLASHLQVCSAMIEGVERYGVGSGSAHLVNGHSSAHHALEEELAEFFRRERVLLFSTGYMANLGVVTALVHRGDAVFEDRLNHASLLDAGLLSGARFRRFAHGDATVLDAQLSASNAEHKLVVSDGVFSMDGDIAPVPDLLRACESNDALLVIDDAHGIGVLGEHGRGTLEAAGLEENNLPVLVGTLGKAFGTSGAFVAGSDDLIETLIQNARSYIYTTATPPAIAEATRVSLKLIQEESWRRDWVNERVSQFRQAASEVGLLLTDSTTPIQPLIVGSADKANALSESLLRNGILVTAIRPPTVPEGSARLRITFSASHTREQVDQLVDALVQAGAAQHE